MAQFIPPTNYLAALQQPDISQATSQLAQNIQGIRQRSQQQAMAQEQQQLAQQYQQDLQNAYATGDFNALNVKYPGQSKIHGEISQEKRENDFNEGLRIRMAQRSDPEIAKNLLDERIAAMQNSGMDARNEERLRQLMDEDPQKARGDLDFYLSTLNPDEWAKISDEEQSGRLRPSELVKAQATADEAITDAEIARENKKIKAMEAAFYKENNDLKREEIRNKIVGVQRTLEQDVREQTSQLQSAMGSIDNLLNTSDRILEVAKNDPLTFSRTIGPIISRFPVLTQGVSDLERLIENMEAQVFTSQIPLLKGTGRLSDRDAARLTASLQSLSIRQSPKQFVKNVKEVQRLMSKTRRSLEQKYGSDVERDMTIPDTPFIQVSPDEINDLVLRYGGSSL